jgi:protein TonB
MLATLTLAAAAASFTPLPFLAGCTPSEGPASAPAETPRGTGPNGPTDESYVAFDSPPVATSQQAAGYPEAARKLGLSGTVFVRVTLAETGRVLDAVIDHRSDAEASIFDEAALTAARAWTFDPAKLDGDPVSCQIIIPFKFQLN